MVHKPDPRLCSQIQAVGAAAGCLQTYTDSLSAAMTMDWSYWGIVGSGQAVEIVEVSKLVVVVVDMDDGTG